MPAYGSASGKVFLAYLSPRDLQEYLSGTKFFRHTPTTIAARKALSRELEKVRRSGYAENREELARDITALAVPVFGRTNPVIAAISISWTPKEIRRKEERNLIEELWKTSAQISRAMGYGPENFGAANPVPTSRDSKIRDETPLRGLSRRRRSISSFRRKPESSSQKILDPGFRRGDGRE